MERKAKQRIKTRTIVSVTVLLVILLGFYTFLNLGQRFATQILGDLVARQTNGFYSLDFSKLDINLLDREIQVEDLYLQADSAKISSETGLNTIYEVELSKLIINFESLMKLYFQRTLEIESMRIVDPEIRMQQLGEKTSRASTFSLKTGNLYKALSDYLTVLKVDYFRIQDGDLSYNSDQFSVGNIDFQVQNLLLDSVARNNVFYSEKVFLEVQNQKYFLPDSVHEIAFDRFVLSTEDSILRFENLSIQPTENSGVLFEDENDFNVYDVLIPELAIKGIDYQSAYRDNHLSIDQLVFTNPQIFIDDESHGTRPDSGDDNSILSLLFTVFKKVEIGELAVKNAALDLKINSSQSYQRLKSEETSISFSNIRIDSSNYRFDKKTEYFDGVSLEIKNYDYILPDSVHEVTLENLTLNSEDSTLLIRSLRVKNKRSIQPTEKLNIEIPLLEMTGFNYQELFNKRLVVRNLLVDRLNLTLPQSARNAEHNDNSASLQGFYREVAPFFDEMLIKRFTIGNAAILSSPALTIGSASLDLEQINMNAATKSFSDLCIASSVTLRDVTFDQDSIKLEGNQVKLRDNFSRLVLQNWDVKIEMKDMQVNGQFDTLQISALYPDSVLAGNIMSFRKALVKSPQLQLKIQTSSNKDQSLAFGMEKEIVILNGKIEAQIDSAYISVDEIDTDFYLGDSIALHNISAQQIITEIPSLHHQMQIRELGYDTLADEIRAVGIGIKPLDRKDTTIFQVSLRLPEILLSGVKQDQFFKDGFLTADRIIIQEPDLLFTPAGRDTVLTATDLEDQKKTKLVVNQLSIIDGNLALEKNAGPLRKLKVKDYSVHLRNLDYQDLNSIFDSESIQVEIGAVLPELTSGTEFSTESIKFDSREELLSVTSLQYSDSEGSIDIIIPNIDLIGLDLARSTREGGLIANSLLFSDPEITFTKKKQTIKNGTEMLSVPPVSLASLNLQNINFTYLDSSFSEKFKLIGADLSLLGVNQEGPISLDLLLQDCEDVILSGPSVTVPVNQLYEVQVGPYWFSSARQTLALQDVVFNPLTTKEEFSARLSTQKDWFKADAKSLQISGLDALKILKDSSIHISKIELQESDLLVYRDKRLPFPEDQVGQLPAEQIASIPMPIRIDTLLVNGKVAYEEHPEDYDITGIITFDQMKAQVTNLTNIDIQPNTLMRLDATGKIMNEGNFQVKAKFELGHPRQRFNFQGIVKDLPMDSLNKMLSPVASIKIKDGWAEKIEFNFLADDSLAIGNMTFLYKDLKLQVLNTKKHETNLKSGLMSFFANTFVVRKKNPRFLFPRKGRIYYKRDPSRAVFGYWGKSLLSGAVSSVGIHKSDRQEKKDARNAER
ncbi:MAG: hypothetical protein AAF616_01520 [Bacteroidota bacterium]